MSRKKILPTGIFTNVTNTVTNIFLQANMPHTHELRISLFTTRFVKFLPVYPGNHPTPQPPFPVRC